MSDSMAFYRRCDDSDAAYICMYTIYVRNVLYPKMESKNWFKAWLHACRMVWSSSARSMIWWYDDTKTSRIKQTHAHNSEQKETLHAAMIREICPRLKRNCRKKTMQTLDDNEGGIWNVRILHFLRIVFILLSAKKVKKEMIRVWVEYEFERNAWRNQQPS